MIDHCLMDGIEGILVSKEVIAEKIGELGSKISWDYMGKDLVMVGVLKGSFIFMADLIRKITIPLETDFIAVSSYGKSTGSSGVVRIIKDMETIITGRHVVIVEDIIDTGLTLDYLKRLLETRKPSSLRICALFDKPGRRKINIKADYSGIEIPDRFIVGYGLDYNGRYRNLEDVCVIKPEEA